MYHYAANNPVRYTDPTGMWHDNGDGTFTAEEGDTLYELYGENWKEKSGFTRDPTTLEVGETVGKKRFLSNHSIFVSYEANNGASVLYAGAGANFDIQNGNFNLNAEVGIAKYEGSWKAFDNKKFNFGLSGMAKAFSADAMIGIQGSNIGVSAGVQVFKAGGSLDFTLFGYEVKIGGEVMVGGIGGAILLGTHGFKVALDLGYGAGIIVEWSKVR